MAIGLPVLAMFGAHNPRVEDLRALNVRANEVVILVGTASGGSECRDGHSCDIVPAQRSYLVFPRLFSDAGVTVVEEHPEGHVVHQEPLAALLVLAVWGLCLFATWRFLIKPFAEASNNALKGRRASRARP
jgi:hypothetical protein